MIDAVDIPVTVKCRTGIKFKGADERYANAEFLLEFVDAVHAAGCERIYLHARNAILGGLTPAQNRDIPPLQPERGKMLKAEFPKLQLVINGGITIRQQALDYLQWADGVMIGRGAYHTPLLMSELHQDLNRHGILRRRTKLLTRIQRLYARPTCGRRTFAHPGKALAAQF